MRIDINADLGEGCGQDEAMLEHVSSINVACGWHAGGADEMRNVVRAAVERGVAIGAHPSHPDRQNFGRLEMDLPLATVRSGLLYQIGALAGIARAEGGCLTHVKAHGALYNQAARDPGLATCIARAIRDFDPALKVVGLAGSLFIDAVRAEGLTALQEGFADRRYCNDGSLARRGTPGAMIDDEASMLSQVLSLVREGRVTTQEGDRIMLHVDTICLHGDGPHALEFARALRARLRTEDIAVGPCR